MPQNRPAIVQPDSRGPLSSLNSLTYEDLGSAAQRDRRKRILDATIALASQGRLRRGADARRRRARRRRPRHALPLLPLEDPPAGLGARAASSSRPTRHFDRRPIPGETPPTGSMYVLGRTTQSLQRDPNLTEALTRAFMFADASVANEIHVVGMHVTRMLMRAIKEPGETPTEDRRADRGGHRDRQGDRRRLAGQPRAVGDRPRLRRRRVPVHRRRRPAAAPMTRR